MTKPTIGILGAGSWGTAVAIHLANCGYTIRLWGKDAEIAAIKNTGKNERFLPGIALPTHIQPINDLNECLNYSDYSILAVPSHAFSEVLDQIDHKPEHLAWLTKGIDPNTNQFLSELVINKWGDDFSYAIISGPSFAKEVAKSLPTALVIAGPHQEFLQALHKLFHHHNIRAYTTHDSIGVQWCGAVKNVLAIACGVSDGLFYGANAKAAIITRGLAEMARMGLKLGAHQETFMGLAGVGDLVLTCTDDQSRNRRFGLKLGQGLSIPLAEKEIGQVVEGKHNAAQVTSVAKTYQVEMPICEQVNLLLKGKISCKEAVHNLMNRPAGEE